MLSDFWLTQADLVTTQPAAEDENKPDDAANAPSPRLVIARLEKLVRDHPAPKTQLGRQVRREVQLALLQLYDLHGPSRMARQTLAALTRDSQTAGDLARRYAGYDRLGEKIKFTVPTTTGRPWTLSSKAGKVVLLHFWSPASQPSVASFSQASTASLPPRPLG